MLEHASDTRQVSVLSMREHPGGVLRTAATVCAVPAALLLLAAFRLLLSGTVFLLLVAAVPALPVAIYLHRGRVQPGGIVRASSAGLDVLGRIVPYEHIEESFESAPRMLTLKLRDRAQIVLEVAGSAAEALTQLGFATERRTVREPLAQLLSPFTQGFLTFVGSMLTLGFLLARHEAAGLGIAFVSSCVLATLVVRVFGYPNVLLGADGLRVSSGLRRSFVPFAALAEVRSEGGTVWLRCHDGTTRILSPAGNAQALAERIEVAWRAFQHGSGLRIEALARGEQTLLEWRRELSALAERGTGFRQMPIDATLLELELGDASAPADRRIGAALALRGQNPKHIERIRGVAGTCADDALRLALEAVCDDTLDEALLERAERRAAR